MTKALAFLLTFLGRELIRAIREGDVKRAVLLAEIAAQRKGEHMAARELLDALAKKRGPK